MIFIIVVMDNLRKGMKRVAAEMQELAQEGASKKICIAGEAAKATSEMMAARTAGGIA